MQFRVPELCQLSKTNEIYLEKNNLKTGNKDVSPTSSGNLTAFCIIKLTLIFKLKMGMFS
ncbi:hypothetical protein DOY81_001493, partial [Sarcophaga bullata]